jgi:CheY-like chemotaxis protein
MLDCVASNAGRGCCGVVAEIGFSFQGIARLALGIVAGPLSVQHHPMGRCATSSAGFDDCRAVLLPGCTRRPDLLTKTLISIVDDDEDFRTSLVDLMQAMGFTVEAFPSAAEFLASPNIRHTSCLIADVHMPLMTGIDLHRRLVEWGLAIPTILVSAYPDERVVDRALGQGVVGYLSKPLDEDTLLGCIRSALQRAKPYGTPP